MKEPFIYVLIMEKLYNFKFMKYLTLILLVMMIFNCVGCSPESHLVFEKIEKAAKKELPGKIEYLYNSTEEYVACVNGKFPETKPVHLIVYSLLDGETVFEYKFDQGNVFWETGADYIITMQLIPGMVMGDEDPEQFLTRYNVKKAEFIK